MPLLTTVRHENNGLEGHTEDGEWVPIRDPLPCVFIFDYSEASKRNVVFDLENKARIDNCCYYQLASFQNNQAVTSDKGVLPYIVYLKRKI